MFASQITLTQTWICSFDSGFVQKLIITAILNIQLNTLSFTSSSAYLSFHFMTQKIIKTENYIILQDTANTLTISQGAVLLNYTYDSAFSADSATSAFSYQQGNYINYPKKALLFETNDSNFVVSDSLSFQNSRNLTTIILPQNSFAYEYNKTFLYFLRNSLSSVSPTFNCSMDHCQYCSIQSNLCDNCDIGYSKNENNSCTLNVCNVLKQRNCLFCDFKGICIQCSDNLVLNLANLCV